MINHSDGNNDNNNTNKENEKIIRYKDLEIEIQRIVTPVVAGALGMIKKNTEDHIKRIPRNLGLQELQKIVLNGTAHLLRRVLSM